MQIPLIDKGSTRMKFRNNTANVGEGSGYLFVGTSEELNNITLVGNSASVGRGRGFEIVATPNGEFFSYLSGVLEKSELTKEQQEIVFKVARYEYGKGRNYGKIAEVTTGLLGNTASVLTVCEAIKSYISN